MKVNEFDEKVTNAVDPGGFISKDEQLVYYPFFDIVSKTVAFATAFISRVVSAPGVTPATEHTVVISYHIKKNDGTEDFSIWCGDKFLEGRCDDQATAEKRAADAVETIGMTGTKLAATLMSMYGHWAESSACNFWAEFRKKKVLCSHTNFALARLRDTRPNFRDELKAKHAAALTTPTSVVPGDLYSVEELLFRVPVLLEGDRGSGKTFEARDFARKGEYLCVESPGHEGLEAPDLLGYLVPVSTEKGRSMVWKDGPLSKAFRKARHEKVVLILDELLRIRQRELSILLTAFSPYEGKYRLPTGRIVDVVDGVGEEEVLECPVENLAVVGTTNVGGEYAVDSMDPAMAERFIVIRKDTEVGRLTTILATLVSAKGFDTAKVKMLVEFFKKMVEAKKQGIVSDIPTTRTLARAVELATVEDDILRGLRSQVLLWVARDADGHPVQEQIDSVVDILERLFDPAKAAAKKAGKKST
jgi:MoxR-like ATPase